MDRRLMETKPECKNNASYFRPYIKLEIEPGGYGTTDFITVDLYQDTC